MAFLSRLNSPGNFFRVIMILSGISRLRRKVVQDKTMILLLYLPSVSVHGKRCL